MTDERKLQIGLAIIRLSTGVFFLVWSLRKLFQPESTQSIFSTFYFIGNVSPVVSYVIGAIQTLIILVFMAGLFKTWTYGALLGMHTVSVLSTYERLLNPYERPNTLFWAAVPTLGALVALFLVRDKDQLLTLGKRR